MPALSFAVIATFVTSIILQVIALSLLPMTQGFTKLMPTLGCAVTFIAGIWMLARIAASGVQLSILIPLSAASVPLAIVAVGVLFYGEPASLLRVGMLGAACVIIGVASNL